MGRYNFSYNCDNERIPASSKIIITDTETGEILKISKNDLSRGLPVQYTQELCDLLFSIDDMFYKIFPVEYRSDEMTKKMIEKYKTKYYEYFPSKYHTKEMQEIFFGRKNRKLKPHIEEGTIVRDFGRYTIKYKYTGARVHSDINVEVVDHETNQVMIFSKKTIQKKDIPFTQELCDALCTIDDLFYKRIPTEFKSRELTLKMIEKYNHQLYEYYPKDYLDYNMTINYVRTSGSHLLFVPDEFINQHLCDLFVFANPKSLSEVPSKYIHNKYFEYIISKDLHLGFVPLEYRTLDVCLMFINKSNRSFSYVPDELIEEVSNRTGWLGIYNLPKHSYWMQTSEEINKIYLKRKKD